MFNVEHGVSQNIYLGIKILLIIVKVYLDKSIIIIYILSISYNQLSKKKITFKTYL